MLSTHRSAHSAETKLEEQQIDVQPCELSISNCIVHLHDLTTLTGSVSRIEQLPAFMEECYVCL